MRKVKISEVDQYYSQQGKPDNHNSETELWLVDLHESLLSVSSREDPVMGLSLELIEEALSLSQGWTGWGFYTHYDNHSVYSSVPVLLFEDMQDAAMVRIRWAGSPWVSKMHN